MNNTIYINDTTEYYNTKSDNLIEKKCTRKRIFEIIEVSKKNDILSLIYDIIMIITIIVSVFPLALKEDYIFFLFTDTIAVLIFIIDYILKFITADYKLENSSYISFIKYPFTMVALIDLLSILPSITNLNESFKLMKIFNMIKTLKIIRLLKAFRYSKSIMIISDVVKESKYPLYAVGTFSLGYILASALIMFNVEPESFDTFFDAIYWSTVSLTTVGYGDLYPVTTEGRCVAMISSIFGIALIALPSSIITAGYMKYINKRNEQKQQKQAKKRRRRFIHRNKRKIKRNLNSESTLYEWMEK